MMSSIEPSTQECNGYIHSTESFGTVDGPGIRLVVFFQGCPMRCLYCHNPDTWKSRIGPVMTVTEILDLYDKNKAFYKNGGLTATGGEPLMQPDFLLTLFTQCRERHIHTCLDTSGISFSKNGESLIRKKLDSIFAVTDLIMLDIKHIHPEHHKKLTGHSNDNILAFLAYLNEAKKAIQIRHVVVPGLTDNPKYLWELGYHLGQFSYIEALDVLPYHSMGAVKYEELGMEYPLKGTRDATNADTQTARHHIIAGMKKRKKIETK